MVNLDIGSVLVLRIVGRLVLSIVGFGHVLELSSNLGTIKSDNPGGGAGCYQ